MLFFGEVKDVEYFPEFLVLEQKNFFGTVFGISRTFGNVTRHVWQFYKTLKTKICAISIIFAILEVFLVSLLSTKIISKKKKKMWVGEISSPKNELLFKTKISD
jgi:hypothetical protein